MGKPNEYDEFWLKIEARRNDVFPVAVLKSPAGTGQGTLRLPFQGDDLKSRATMLEHGIHLSRSASPSEATRGVVRKSREVRPIEVGGELFESLFKGTVGSLFDKSLGMAQGKKGLRIKLHISPEDPETGALDPELAALVSLPWELLYHKETREHLSLTEATPLVRYLDVQRPYELPAFLAPLRILVVLSNPKGTTPLDLEKERAAIEKSWATLDDVEVDIIEQVTRQQLQNALSEKPYHVLHFMGHGSFDEETGQGTLLLEGEHGEPVPMSGHTLGVWLRDMPSMRLVFLNACETARGAQDAQQDPFAGVATALVMAGVPAVVAMQLTVADWAAISFAEGFYRSLSQNKPVDAAVVEGRKEILAEKEGAFDWAIPVLFMRSPDGQLFKADRRIMSPLAWGLSVAALIVMLLLVGGLAMGLTKTITIEPEVPSVSVNRTVALQAFADGMAVESSVWASSDTSIATVEQGRITGRNPGVATITARLGWFSRAEVEATVFEPVATSLQVQPRQISLFVGESLALRSIVRDAEGYPMPDHVVSWMSSDSSLVQATSEGVFQGVGAGQAMVYAHAAEGLIDSAQVAVMNPIIVDEDTLTEPEQDAAAPSLIQFVLSETSTYLKENDSDSGLDYYTMSGQTEACAACRTGTEAACDDCWWVQCDRLIASPRTLEAVRSYLQGRDQPELLQHVESHEAFEQLVYYQGEGALFSVLPSTKAQWDGIDAPETRETLENLYGTCTGLTSDLLLFSITLKNQSSGYTTVSAVEYHVLQDFGEAAGGDDAGLLRPIAQYVHEIERTCREPEVFSFPLQPPIELEPDRSKSFELQPSFSVEDYPSAFLAPLLVRIEIVTDKGNVVISPFLVEAPSCAG